MDARVTVLMTLISILLFMIITKLKVDDIFNVQLTSCCRSAHILITNDYTLRFDTSKKQLHNANGYLCDYTKTNGVIGDLIRKNELNNNNFVLIYNKKACFVFIYEISNQLFPTQSFALRNQVQITEDHMQNLERLEKEIYDDPVDMESIKNLLFLIRERFFNIVFCCTQTHLIGYSSNWKNIQFILRVDRERVLRKINLEYMEEMFTIGFIFKFPRVIGQFIGIPSKINFIHDLDSTKFNDKYSIIGLHITDVEAIKTYNKIKNMNIIRKIESHAPKTIINEWLNAIANSNGNNNF